MTDTTEPKVCGHACREEDREMVNTPSGQELIAKAVSAIKHDTTEPKPVAWRWRWKYTNGGFSEWELRNFYCSGNDDIEADQLYSAETVQQLQQRNERLLAALSDVIDDLELRSNLKVGEDCGLVDLSDGIYRRAKSIIAESERQA